MLLTISSLHCCILQESSSLHNSCRTALFPFLPLLRHRRAVQELVDTWASHAFHTDLSISWEFHGFIGLHYSYSCTSPSCLAAMKDMALVEAIPRPLISSRHFVKISGSSGSSCTTPRSSETSLFQGVFDNLHSEHLY